MYISLSVELLLKYAVNHGLIEGLDIVLCRNLLLDELGVSHPFEGEIDTTDNLDTILAPILDYAYESGFIKENTTTQRDLFEGKLMGILTPRQKQVECTFRSIEKNQGVEAATGYFHSLSSVTNYIKTERIKKNLKWKYKTNFGDIDITINLSKPEKDPKDIAAALNDKGSGYPKCLLCVENVGFAGHLNHPARQNHRVIPITLDGENWYLQYSPYAYYDEHCIPLCGEHRPISITHSTFEKLLDFLERFPHYFVGSNADLPIVGGSILNHDHFQGGKGGFPIESAKTLKQYMLGDVKAEIIRWPMSVIRLKSGSRVQIAEAADIVLNTWRKYEDKSVGIIPYSEGVPHNTVTPIARINAWGEYEMDLVLRNNRTNTEYPDGIFHPHPHIHHIKKENIGLIEVMGLAILPGRLAEEVQKLQGDERKKKEESIGAGFLEALMHAGVYKIDNIGLAAFIKFMQACGAKEI